MILVAAALPVILPIDSHLLCLLAVLGGVIPVPPEVQIEHLEQLVASATDPMCKWNGAYLTITVS